MTDGRDTATGRSLIVAPRLDLTQARRLAQAIRARVGQPLDIDASRVEVLGGLGLQVLLAAGQHWRRDGLALRLVATSAAFDAALRQFGLDATAITGGAPA